MWLIESWLKVQFVGICINSTVALVESDVLTWEIANFNFTLPTLLPHCKERGSHLYVWWWSVCDQDQNSIKRSRPLLKTGPEIKVTFELRKSTDWECPAAIWPLTHRKLGNKSFRRGQSSGQAHLVQIKKLHPSCKHLNTRHINDYPLQTHVSHHALAS